MINILKIVLFLSAIVLIFFSVKVIRDYPNNDKKIKEIYSNVVHEIKDIEKVQLYYKYKKGNFTDNIDSLNLFLSKDSIVSIKEPKKLQKVSDLVFEKNKARKLGFVSTPFSKVSLQMKVDTIKRKKDSILTKDTKLSIWAKKKELLKGFSQEIIDREMINSHNNGILADSISLTLSGKLEKNQYEANWPASYELLYKEETN